MRTKDWIALVSFLLLSLGAGGISSLFTTPAIPTWYATLVRPDIAPPSWVFGPVWTTLYLLMGIAAFFVWRKGRHHHAGRVALGLFLVQLALNALWSFIFFGLQNLPGAFVEIVLLWVMIVATMRAFAHVSRTAAWLLAPYLAWVTFAAYLSHAFWQLNG